MSCDDADVARTSRGNPSLGDIVRSVAVLVGAVALVAVAINLVNDPEPRLPDPVDYEPVLQVARDEFGYPVLAPEPVPDGWRATSVDLDQSGAGDRWRLGLLTEDEQFIGLEQADGEIETYRRDRLAGFSPDGESQVDGQSWERMVEEDRTPDRVLVRVDDGALTIVRGTVSYEALEDFTASLR